MADTICFYIDQSYECFVHRISLNTMTLNVESPRVYTRHGVPISVTGIAQVSKLDCINLHALSCVSVECVVFVR